MAVGALRRRVPVELFTATSRITGEILTHHIHIRDELNDERLSMLIFAQMEVATLSNLRGARLHSREAWLAKDDVLLAVPCRVKGTTSMLAQHSIRSRLGKNEHRVLIEIPPFRVVGNLYFVGKFRIQDALRRDPVPFAFLTGAQATFLPDPTISFVADELVFNTGRVKMLCSRFKTQEGEA